jgi:type IV pilus assembly protein PilV
MMTPRTNRHSQSGASMIEVLVSLTIVAFGLLGLAGLQARSMTFQKDSFDRKAAAEMAAQLAERIRANYDGFRDGNYNVTLLPNAGPLNIPSCANQMNCTSAEVAAIDWATWVIALRSRLPISGAHLDAPVIANNQRVQLKLTMAWQEGGMTDPNSTDTICTSVPQLNINNDPRFRCFQWILHP